MVVEIDGLLYNGTIIVCLTPTVFRELSECTVNRISEEGIYYEV